jgi:hypothetical protein
MSAPRYMTPTEIDALLPETHFEQVDDPPPWDGEPVIGARPPEARPSGLKVLRWGDLLAEPPEQPPVIRAGLPKVGVTVLAGPPKVGKTLLAEQWALEAGLTTTLVIEEGSLSGLAYRLRRQAEALDVVDPDIEVLHRQRIRLDERSSVRRLRNHLAGRFPGLVIFDPLNRLHGADENRPTQMTPVMDALASIAYDLECAVLTVHHLSKPSQERRGDIWDRFRGASAIRSGTDANLAMDGTGEHLHLVGEFRDAEPLSEYLELDRNALVFRSIEAPRLPGKIDQGELRAFISEREHVTVAEVATRFGCSKNTAQTALFSISAGSYDGPRGTRFYTLATAQ